MTFALSHPAPQRPPSAVRVTEGAMWPGTASELARVQLELAGARPPPWIAPGPRSLAAACFICFARGGSYRAWAAAALVRGDRRVVGTAAVGGLVEAGYEPGLLALREGSLLEAAVRALPEQPEVVIANATGRDHPRGAGLALHLGAVLDLPSIGVTDRPLLATGFEPGHEPGATSPLLHEDMEVARLLRTRAGARPLVVHPGWRTDLDTAVSVVMATIRRARTPEPLRHARRTARRARAAQEQRSR